ncbi:MAG: hypothetical protein ACE5OO_02365 [Candidatus Bathyarchaeia archaeon]
MIGRKELTSEDVRKLVFKAIELIADAQRELELPICPHLPETRGRLRRGRFRAEPLRRRSGRPYAMEYGCFEPPATIVLDSNLPFCDRPFSIPQLPLSLAAYSATHEVIHADDHTGGDRMLVETRRHILNDHQDKLERGMEIIEQGGGGCIRSYEELAALWAMQYVDMATHYRAYVVLRHRRFPKLDLIWAGLRNDFFPPHLLSHIERQKGTGYVFDIITRRAGEYCLIDAFRESESIGEKNTLIYTV